MTNRFIQDAKLLYKLLKLYRCAYIPDPVISMMNIATCTMAWNVASAIMNGTATGTTALFSYLVIANIIAIASHNYGKRELFKEVETSLAGLYRSLDEILVAQLSGARKQSDIGKWLRRYKVPTRPQIERLNFAYEMFCSVSEITGRKQAHAWFTSANAGSDEISPAKAIRLDRFEDVRISATKMVQSFQDRNRQD